MIIHILIFIGVSFIEAYGVLLGVGARAAWAARATTIGREIEESLRSLANGSEPDDLPAMDPVNMNDITFCRGFGTVRANIHFPSSSLAGVSAVDVVTGVRCSYSESTLSFSTHHARVVQSGSYNLTGTFAEVFAVGKGKARIVLKDVTIHHLLKWRRAQGQLRVRDYRGRVEPKDMSVHYSNLWAESRDVLDEECRRRRHDGHNLARLRLYRPSRNKRRRHKRRFGRKVVDVNKYFNDNWQLLYEPLSKSVSSAFSAVFRDYMDVVLRRLEGSLLTCSQ